MDKTYREIWEQACAEGRGGMEDGRPFVEGEDRPIWSEGWTVVNNCNECVSGRDCPERGKWSEAKCADCNPTMTKSFFWPANEPLPEVK